MLAEIIGNKTTAKILMHIYHYNEIHASAIAQDYNISLTSVLYQLNHLESSGVLVSKTIGRSRLYQFNLKSPYTRPLLDMIKISYETMPLDQKQKTFKSRRHPRRKGKPVK